MASSTLNPKETVKGLSTKGSATFDPNAPVPTITKSSTKSPWAILLCKFKDNSVEPYERQRYLDLFTSSGVGKSGMVDYFTDISHGLLDISGSQVFGWFIIDKNRSEYLGLQSRGDIVNWARSAAAAAGVNLAPFHSVVVVMNVPTDLFGSPAGVVCDDGRLPANGMSGLSPSFLGQEMLHGYSLGHARTDGSLDDYTDLDDIMSTASAAMTPHPIFTERDNRANPVFLMGPGLNAASMASLGWLDNTRVWSNNGIHINTVIRLRPLHRRDLSGFLAAQFGQYYVEFRDKDRWDAGIFAPVVRVHRFDDSHSYVMNGNEHSAELQVGDSFGSTPLPPPFVNFEPVLRVEVVAIDSKAKFADIRLVRQPGLHVPVTGAEAMFGAASRGGEGIVVLPGGGIKRVPPNSPLAGMLRHVAVFEDGAAVSSLGLQQQVRRQALTQIIAIATRQLDSMAEIREPARTLKTDRTPVMDSEQELYGKPVQHDSVLATVKNLVSMGANALK